MRNKLIIVTDLRTFKAFWLDKDQLNSSPRLELLEDFQAAEDKLTDQAGRFPRSSGGGTQGGELSNGERHNHKLEIERRVVKTLADKMNTLLRRDDVVGCYFAAHPEINRPILDHLLPAARAKIEKNVTANLTKIDKSELLGHF